MSDDGPTLNVVRVNHGRGLAMPQYESEEAAGMDLLAGIGDAYTLKPGERFTVPAGIEIEIPKGYEGQVRSRSGLAAKHGIAVLNSPGTIDSDYRGEVKVILINNGEEPYTIRRGERIAQLVIAPVSRVKVKEKLGGELSDTKRGKKGLGSTGKGGQKVSVPEPEDDPLPTDWLEDGAEE